MRRAERLHVERFLEWERACTLRLNRTAISRRWAGVLGAVSRLSDGGLWIALMVGLPVLGAQGRACSLHMAFAGLAAVLLYKVLKRCTGRARPCQRIEDVRPCVAPLDEFSFPSGHTLHAVTFTTVMLAHYPALAPVLVPFTVLVAISRIALGLHYPSDVIAGAAIGCLVAVLTLTYV